MALEPMKPRSTRYFRLSLGPRKPVLDRRRHEDDGWMNEQMMQQTDDQNYRLTWREGKNWGMAEVRRTGQIYRYVGRVEKGSGESDLLLKTGLVALHTLITRTRAHGCAAMSATSVGAVWHLVPFLVHQTVLDGDFRIRQLIFQVPFNASRFTH